MEVGLGTLVDVSPNCWPFVEVFFSQKWVFFRYFLDISTKTTTKITFYCIHCFITPPPENFVHSIFIYCLPNLTKINTGTVSELLSQYHKCPRDFFGARSLKSRNTPFPQQSKNFVSNYLLTCIYSQQKSFIANFNKIPINVQK